MKGTGTVRLPAQSTSFVGRAAELDALTALLHSSRLVTVTGPAGMGKTRLAIEVARRLDGDADVHFAGLAALTDGHLVANEVAARLGAPERAGEPVPLTLARYIGARRTLLLLDNCEYLVADCARLVETLLRGCPELHVLATSLQPLRVPGEILWHIAPLTLPLRHEVGDSEAVRLFEARARQVSPRFTVGPDNAEAVATLCRRLEGIPLAIELAAARMETLSVQEVLGRLDDRRQFLDGGSAAGGGRHRTLEAALDWGYQLLDGRERRLFRRVSVFAGAFELSTAEAVCSGDGLDVGDVSDLVFRLVERSLLQIETTAGAARYRLLEPVRGYAAERLAESGEPLAVAERHAAWYLALARRAEREERGQDQTGWLERLEAARDELRAALAWFCGHDVESGLVMAAALSWYWVTRGHFGEGRGWLDGALSASAPDAAGRARGLLAAAQMAFWQGDYEAARRLCESSLELPRVSGDAAHRGWSLTLLGSIHGYQGEHERGAERFEEAIAATGDELVRLEAMVGMGELLLQAGDLAQARARLEDVARLARGPEAPRGRAALFLGLVALFGDDHATAQAELARSLDVFQRLGNRYGAAAALDALAGLAMANADPVRALRLSGAAAGIRDSTRSQLSPRWREVVRAVVLEPARAAAGERAEDAWDGGREMSFDEAIRYARTGLIRAPAPRPAASGRAGRRRSPAGLTARELEVAEHVTRGLTNRQIAELLVIAERTVEGHVERIRAKLNVRSRTQIAASIARERAWPSS